MDDQQAAVTVDFLIEPADANSRAGKLFDIERDFAAIIAPGLHLAFQNRRKITNKGETNLGESASRDIWVCGAGALVVLKRAFVAQRLARANAPFDTIAQTAFMARSAESPKKTAAARLSRVSPWFERLLSTLDGSNTENAATGAAHHVLRPLDGHALAQNGAEDLHFRLA